MSLCARSESARASNAREDENEPMDEAELVNGLDGEHTLGHVEARDVLAEGVVLDQHRHEVSSGKELHEEVKIVRVLERVVQLHDPGRVRLGEDVALGADVRELVDRRSVSSRAQTTWSRRRTWSFLNISAFFKLFIA